MDSFRLSRLTLSTPSSSPRHDGGSATHGDLFSISAARSEREFQSAGLAAFHRDLQVSMIFFNGMILRRS
jgi:hypothetical protein